MKYLPPVYAECYMNIEEKKLLTDVLEVINSIDKHWEGRRLLL
jgi:hypothetical protein